MNGRRSAAARREERPASNWHRKEATRNWWRITPDLHHPIRRPPRLVADTYLEADDAGAGLGWVGGEGGDRRSELGHGGLWRRHGRKRSRMAHPDVPLLLLPPLAAVHGRMEAPEAAALQ